MTTVLDVNKKLKLYIENNIITQYKKFDKAHNKKHIYNVISSALKLNTSFNADPNIVFTAASYHDLGLGYLKYNPNKSRRRHHIYSEKLVHMDQKLKDFFTLKEIDIIAQACLYHRASSKDNPPSIYGKIIADSDRMDGLEIRDMILRAWNYSNSFYPNLDIKAKQKDIYHHLRDKYGEGGYLYNSFYLKESKEMIKEVIKESTAILASKDRFNRLFEELIANN
ncbi:HD domain-containing protein [Halonatronum saccharophilum]|uniref:HD domain-containing protein n=1 Tax=Halonatronum saccharophilum TaxID=150060 RepID=UPI0004823E12|nr:HD domain-containing protein [Halonatronum saccharophilum]